MHMSRICECAGPPVNELTQNGSKEAWFSEWVECFGEPISMGRGKKKRRENVAGALSLDKPFSMRPFVPLKLPEAKDSVFFTKIALMASTVLPRP